MQDPGRERRFSLVMGLLVGLLGLTLVLNVNLGSVQIQPGQIFSLIGRAIYCRLADYPGLEDLIKSTTESQILFRIRLPRILLVSILGGALAVSGFLLQIFFANPIAGPFVLGISSGAKMLVGISIIFLAGPAGFASSTALIVAAFSGSVLITFLVLVFARRLRNMSMLLVIGIMLSYICGAVTDFAIHFAYDHEIANLTSWSMGSFSGASWDQVSLAARVCLPSLVLAFLMAKPISAYMLGETYAESMGLNVKYFRLALILVSSLLSATVTALAGPISFVGIAVPHLTRALLKTAKPALVIPACFLCGSVFTAICDLIARTALAPTELAIGTVTAFFGAPVVIYMLVKRQKWEGV